MPFGVVERVKAASALQFDAWGGQIADDMQPVQGDLVIPKYGMCAFQTTNLHNELQARGIKNVIVAGFLTNGSVESTIRTAYEKCYNVFALTDCCAACTMEEHVFSIQQNMGMFAQLSSASEILQALMTD
jgi:nicotinamidase-related amidase